MPLPWLSFGHSLRHFLCPCPFLGSSLRCFPCPCLCLLWVFCLHLPHCDWLGGSINFFLDLNPKLHGSSKDRYTNPQCSSKPNTFGIGLRVWRSYSQVHVLSFPRAAEQADFPSCTDRALITKRLCVIVSHSPWHLAMAPLMRAMCTGCSSRMCGAAPSLLSCV